MAPSRLRVWAVGALCAAAVGCARATSPAAEAHPAPRPLDYAAEAHWLCRPGLPNDLCRSADLTATAIRPDGAHARVPGPAPAAEPAYDCFYLYPTVALDFEVGNADVRALRERARDPVVAQAARFRGQCRLFVPLYRQITITTYMGVPDPAPYLERAYADVEAAFRHYLTHDGGDRPFVILGHSQGAQMGRRLLRRVVAPDPALRRRLIAAVLLGGDVLVNADDGRATNTGGVPLCTSTDHPGCVIAYRTYLRDRPPPGGNAPTVPGRVPPGEVTACVDPAALGGGHREPTDGETHFAGAYLPTRAVQRAYDPWQGVDPPASTPFVLYRGFYAGRCARDAAGFPFLAVHAAPGPGDVRENLLPFRADLYRPGLLGLHLLDHDLPLADLLAVVNRLAAATVARNGSHSGP